MPACFAAVDPSADGRIREIEIDRTRVIVRRAVAGVRMRLNVPIESYLGVVVRIEPDVTPDHSQIAVVLAHRDPALSVTLSAADDCDDVIADWQAWAKSLGCPLLIGNGDGSWREPMTRLGAVVVTTPSPRRRRHSPHTRRRPKALMRRKPGRPAATAKVYRDECEIIARS
ncbi:DUF6101 family protein [Blastochloris viridis]|uniref:Uncharacterized protein n=1 Tax=Blastochloris viridis TaxID=1079 RepID=A0A182CZE5_BLAVI|nr:DUF6101 family protein [Blastochloris viridis]BAR98167.1 hypothetical protein BV133_574 [Blastochloris viridis]